MTGHTGHEGVAPPGTPLLGELLSSGLCDDAVQYETGRVLMAMSRSAFGSPREIKALGGEAMLEALERLDDSWESVRAAWAGLAAAGAVLAGEKAAAVERTGGDRAARLEALSGLPSDASYRAARAGMAEALGRLADVYQRYPASGRS
ncbi:hypothetical protein FNH09_12515 [Streptomyces adustus]|uniref:Uncharacterized protein n=1 Tax=Streptomyces adustus TaxID=1609272 RepID=A0A5N8VAM9_9ACTN|nr:hypothetical protein [Streptomyces adustus]MPY32079.1 hypothetical protein [Streptomyces adustus]